MTSMPTDQDILAKVVLIDPQTFPAPQLLPAEAIRASHAARRRGGKCTLAFWPDDPTVSIGFCIYDARQQVPTDAQIVRVYRAMRDFSSGPLA